MSDGDNPYRFTGEAAEDRVSATDQRDLTLYDLIGIDTGRRVLAALISFSSGTLFATFVPVGWFGWNFAPNALLAFLGSLFLFVSSCVLMFFCGLQLMPHLHRRFAAFYAIALAIPVVGLFVGVAVLHDATRALVDRGVKIGWLKSDFDDAKRRPLPNTASK